MESNLFVMKIKDLNNKVKEITNEEIFIVSSHFNKMVNNIFDILIYDHFCKKTRLFTNVVFLLVQDLIKMYSVLYMLITELLERFGLLSYDESKKALETYEKFVLFTKKLDDKL